jgi:hypothetical protein
VAKSSGVCQLADELGERQLERVQVDDLFEHAALQSICVRRWCRRVILTDGVLAHRRSLSVAGLETRRR